MSTCQIKFNPQRNVDGTYDIELWINGQFDSSWKPTDHFISHEDLEKFSKMVIRGIEHGKEDAKNIMRGALGLHGHHDS